MSERNRRSKNGQSGPSSSSRGRSQGKDKSTNDSRRSKGKAISTEESKYWWSPSYTKIFLELVNFELKAKGYVVTVPDNHGKAKIVDKFYEMTGVRLNWKLEMKNRLDYMRSLWHCNNSLINRTGIAVDPITGKIDMPDIWWTDRIKEFGKNAKYVRVLQNKPLPFKEILDEIYSKHDVEQDDRYSPHTLRAHLQQSLNEGDSNDDIEVDETSEDNESQHLLEVSSDDDDLPRAVQSPIPTTKEQARSSPSRINRSNLGVRKTTSRRTNRKRINFETQVQRGFQRLDESRTGLLDVLRSRHNPKATFGDALAELEKLAVEPMGTFWWAVNRLLMNDEDIRDGFMKLRNEENKIQFLEKLAGVDRYGYPCDNINLRGSSSSTTPYFPTTHSQMAGINTNASTSFSPGYGMFEMGSSGTNFSTLLGLSPQTK